MPGFGAPSFRIGFPGSPDSGRPSSGAGFGKSDGPRRWFAFKNQSAVTRELSPVDPIGGAPMTGLDHLCDRRIMHPYSFRLFTAADLPKAERWRKAPELVRWWGDPTEDSRYSGKILSSH